jgi:hypothetical protein
VKVGTESLKLTCLLAGCLNLYFTAAQRDGASLTFVKIPLWAFVPFVVKGFRAITLLLLSHNL